jgi:hypothetical protein
MQIGSTAIYNNKSYGHHGLWSCIILKISTAGIYTVEFDGIIVPPAASNGCPGPQNWPILNGLTSKDLIIIETDKTPLDKMKRLIWKNKVTAYLAEEDAQKKRKIASDHEEMFNKYGIISLGVSVEWTEIIEVHPMNGGRNIVTKKQGIVKDVNYTTYDVVVKFTDGTEKSINVKELIFLD